MRHNDQTQPTRRWTGSCTRLERSPARAAEAAGLTQAAWAAQLGYGRRTVQRWEMGELVPDAAATEALINVCSEQRLCRRYGAGPLSGVLVIVDWLRAALSDARWGSTPVADRCDQA